jgi:hypothetical protein
MKNIMEKLFLGIFILLFHSLNHWGFGQIINYNPDNQPKKKVKMILSFDGRRSFIQNQNVKIGGLRIGIQYKNLVRTGIGFYGFDKPIQTPIEFQGNNEQTKANETLQYGYATIFFEPILYKIRKWEISLPLSLGGGDARISILDSSQKILESRVGKTGFFEGAIYAENRVFWWAGIGLGAGYRRVLNTEIIEGKRLNGPYYQIAIKIYLGEIARKIFRKGDKE